MPEYNIFELGFDKTLDRSGQAEVDVPSLPRLVQSVDTDIGGGVGSFTGGFSSNSVESQISPQVIGSGTMAAILSSGKPTFSSTVAGYRMGVDSDGEYKWVIGDASSSADWNVTTADTFTITGAGLVSPVIRYGKTSFTDSTNAGYYLSSAGIYVGAASDTSKLKYTVADGTFDFIGTVSSRSTVTLAASINSSGNLVTDVINARLDSSAKTILAGFNFGATNYAGAVNAGDITWNTTTGAITGGSGVIVYRSGIVGVAAGVTTFSIDATTGTATFAGTLSAATGSFAGSLTAATGSLGALTVSGSVNISTSGNIRSGQTAYNTGTGFFLEYNGGTPRFSIGDGTVANSMTWDGTTFTAVPTNVDVQTFTADGTWTKPSTNIRLVKVICIGGGGGGGGGYTNNGGGSGGGGGAYTEKKFLASDLAATVSVTVGAAGTAGVGGSPPTNGGAGGNSSFGTFVFVYGGGGGNGTSTVGGATVSGGGGGGTLGAGQAGQSNANSLGGLPATTAGANGFAGQGSGGVNASAGKNAEFGGGAGGGGVSTGHGGSSMNGGGGGGKGGQAASDLGSTGGASGSYAEGGGGVNGSPGAAGQNGTSLLSGFGGGGGNGSAGTGGAGGAGGTAGGGGGGGGRGDTAGGAGGAGGRGEVRVWSW